jgi:outer membrane protein assembly factor BamE (lipoprotein component of BamABCDE complex)
MRRTVSVPLQTGIRYDCGQFRPPGPDAQIRSDMRQFVTVLLLLGIFSSSGCILYEQDIEQGNVLTPEMIQQIKPGMTRKQVQLILGTPLVADVFHSKRWDYYYSLQPGGKDITKKLQLTILFEGDRVTEIVRRENNGSESKLTGQVND